MKKQANGFEKSFKTTMQEDESKFYNDISSLLQTAHVDGIGMVKTLIEVGYSGCAISLDLLTDSIISEIDSVSHCEPFSLRDLSKKFDLGFVNLDVSYLDKTVTKLLFRVVNKLHVPMILGASWICKSNAILQSDGSKLKVLFGEKKKNPWYWELLGTDYEYGNCIPTRVSVEVDDGVFGPVRARISTGNSQSCIRKELLTELQLSKLIPISDEIKGLVSLNVTYEGMATYLEDVHVVSEIDYPEDELILGMNWVNKSRVVMQANGTNVTVSPAQTKNVYDQKSK